MDIEIITTTENPMLKRQEVSFKVMHEGESTPSRDVVRAKLAAMLNADQDRTILKVLNGSFGLHEAMGECHVYEDKETAMKLEAKYILIRNGLIEKDA